MIRLVAQHTARHRIIITTAIEEELTLLTSDSEIVKYQDVKTLWQITKED